MRNLVTDENIVSDLCNQVAEAVDPHYVMGAKVEPHIPSSLYWESGFDRSSLPERWRFYRVVEDGTTVDPFSKYGYSGAVEDFRGNRAMIAFGARALTYDGMFGRTVDYWVLDEGLEDVISPVVEDFREDNGIDEMLRRQGFFLFGWRDDEVERADARRKHILGLTSEKAAERGMPPTTLAALQECLLNRPDVYNPWQDWDSYNLLKGTGLIRLDEVE